MPARIQWSGPFFATYSFGEVCRNYLFALNDISADVRSNNVKDHGHSGFEIGESIKSRIKKLSKKKLDSPYINITYNWPTHAVNDKYAHKNVSFFPIEHSSCDPNWIEKSSWCDEYWVPSHFNYLGALNAGISNEKLFIVPHGVDPLRFNPSVEPLDIPGKNNFAFLAVSNYVNRKGWDILIKAFAREFTSKDKVCLICKTNNPKALYDASILYFKNPNSPQLIVLSRKLNLTEMPMLFTAADCFVLPSRAEGWGMCYLEAMAAGLPTIGTNYSGNLEFMNAKNSMLVEINELRPDMEFINRGGIYQMAEPDQWDLRKKMRLVYEDSDLRNDLSGNGLETADQFSWKNQSELIVSRCEHLTGIRQCPLWNREMGNIQLRPQSPGLDVLEVIIFASDNSYLLAKSLRTWKSTGYPVRINLVQLFDDYTDADFIQQAMSHGLIDEIFRFDPTTSYGDCLSEVLGKIRGEFVHIGVSDSYPYDAVGLATACEILSGSKNISACGGYTISPYKTFINGPFKKDTGTIDTFFIGKSIKSNQVSKNVFRTESAKYLHHDTMVVRRESLMKHAGLYNELKGMELSGGLSKAISGQDGMLMIVGSLQIVVEDLSSMAGSFNTNEGVEILAGTVGKNR